MGSVDVPRRGVQTCPVSGVKVLNVYIFLFHICFLCCLLCCRLSGSCWRLGSGHQQEVTIWLALEDRILLLMRSDSSVKVQMVESGRQSAGSHILEVLLEKNIPLGFFSIIFAFFNHIWSLKILLYVFGSLALRFLVRLLGLHTCLSVYVLLNVQIFRINISSPYCMMNIGGQRWWIFI